tara:strand:- start:101 stop:736 length:636 start_codon:yes stop_codon:yes gene_type:complete
MAVRKTAKGAALKRWFKEDWKDVSTGKACGRKKGDGRSTPYCRPSKRVSSKTPKTSGEMTAAQKKSRIAQKKSLGQPAGKPRRVASLTRRNTVKKMNEGGKVKSSRKERGKALKESVNGVSISKKYLKAVPEDKKKSLGKLPMPVRNKMGFMKEGGKVFKSHMMYDKKTGKAVKAPTKAKHLELKDKGYGHTKPKKMKAGGLVDRQYLKGK